MAQQPLGPPPRVETGSVFDRWMNNAWNRITKAGQLLWSQIDFTGSNLTDLATRNHADLQNINTASYTHLTATNHTDLTDGGDSTLHYHATDRDSANFTGTSWTDLTDGGATTLHKHDHGGMDGLADDDHTQYILANGTRVLTGDWDAGEFTITSKTIIAGDHGNEGASIQLDAVATSASLKASDINDTHLADLVLHRHSATNKPTIVSARAHNTGNNHTTVSDGDVIGSWVAAGWATNSYYSGGEIAFVVDGTPGTGDMPTSIVIKTTPDGAYVPVERVRFKPDGRVQFGVDGVLEFDEHSSAGGTPAAGKVAMYAKADGKLYSKDDAGTETELGGGGGASVNNVITAVKTISAETSYIVAQYLTIKSDLTNSGNIMVIG